MIIKFSLNFQSDADIFLFYKSGIPFNKIMKNALLCYFGAEYKELRVKPSNTSKIIVRPVLSLNEEKDAFLVECMSKVPTFYRIPVIKSAIREYLKPYFKEYLGFDTVQEKAIRSVPVCSLTSGQKEKKTVKRTQKTKSAKISSCTEIHTAEKTSEQSLDIAEEFSSDSKFSFADILGDSPDDVRLEETPENDMQNIQNELFGLLSSF